MEKIKPTVLFVIDDDMSYERMVVISESLVRLTLNRGYGCLFYYDLYNKKLIKMLKPKFYFTITDNFIEFSYNYLFGATEEDVLSAKCKTNFYEAYSIFDEIYILLKSFDVKSIKLIISYNEENPKDFSVKSKNDSLFVDMLYECFVQTKKLNTLSNILIN